MSRLQHDDLELTQIFFFCFSFFLPKCSNSEASMELPISHRQFLGRFDPLWMFPGCSYPLWGGSWDAQGQFLRFSE